MRAAAKAATILIALATTAASAHADGKERVRFDLEVVQGQLAVQRLDGWLLHDEKGRNALATWLVNPAGEPAHGWFYLLPRQGEPALLVHQADAGKFAGVPGTVVAYAGYRDLTTGLKKLLAGKKKVAMEYAPGSGIPSLTRVDAATVDLVRKQNVAIESSAGLVQFTKSLWGPVGRINHYVAAHHIDALRKDALAFIAERIRAGKPVTEREVSERILKGYMIRGIEGPAPVVAAGTNSADPQYRPAADGSAEIRKGDVIRLGLSARLQNVDRPIFAELSWTAYVGDQVPTDLAETFAVVAQARDAALELIGSRIERRRPVKGFEPDKRAREVIGKARLGPSFVHRTGHSLDTSAEGDGANLDDYETHDTRNLVTGAGFTVEPGVYVRGRHGIRTGVSVFIAPDGIEVTTPVQTQITPIL